MPAVTATADQLAELRAVNAKWNVIPYNAVPGPDEPPEFWGDKPVGGWSWTCRCYTEAKAEDLRASGWDVADLLAVFLWTEVVGDPNDQWGGREYHCVLRVNAGGDIYILDSRVQDPAQIYLWTEPPFDYRWSMEQVAGTDGFRDVSTTGLA